VTLAFIGNKRTGVDHKYKLGSFHWEKRLPVAIKHNRDTESKTVVLVVYRAALAGLRVATAILSSLDREVSTLPREIRAGSVTCCGH